MKGISLFSGMGGDTLGMKNAGIDVVGYVELVEYIRHTHDINFPDCEYIGSDITKIPNQRIERYKEVVDILFAGFSCQGFSHAGSKKPDDPRNTLFREFVRFTDVIKPKIIIGENVKGLLTRTTPSDEKYIDVIVKSFQDIGYEVIFSVLKCHMFEVPQKRERLFIIGIRKDVVNDYNLSFPLPSDNLKGLTDIVEFNMYGAIREDFVIPEECILTDMENNETENNVHKYLVLKQRDHLFSFEKRISPHHCEIINIFNPSKTIICGYDFSPRLLVPLKNRNGTFLRCLLPDELKQIQGFPKDFEIVGTPKQQITQIGNAVPPLVVTTLINHICKK